MWKQFVYDAALAIGLVGLGCQRPSTPSQTDGAGASSAPAPAESLTFGASQPKSDASPAAQAKAPAVAEHADSAQRGQPPATETTVSQHSAEQRAAARQLIADLGVEIEEDADGNVTRIDTAAKRSWVDDAQMLQILVFPQLRALTVEGPSITDELVPRIAELNRLTSLTMQNTLISDGRHTASPEGAAQLRDPSKLMPLRC